MYIVLLQVVSIKAIGIAIKLTLEGVSQIAYPQTWFFLTVAIICVVTQLNYLNKVSIALLILAPSSRTIVTGIYVATSHFFAKCLLYLQCLICIFFLRSCSAHLLPFDYIVLLAYKGGAIDVFYFCYISCQFAI